MQFVIISYFSNAFYSFKNILKTIDTVNSYFLHALKIFRIKEFYGSS